MSSAAPATTPANNPELYTDASMNQRILDDIAQLQDTEKGLLEFLGTDTLTNTQKTEVRQKINSLVDMRYRMYQQIGLLNRYYTDALEKTDKVLVDQADAIQVMENTLSRMKRERDSLKDENTNQVRLIQISDYYADRYQANTQLVKILIFTLLPIILLTFLHNEGILDNTIFYVMAGVVGMIGAFYFWRTMLDINQRNNMNFDQYDYRRYRGSGNAPVTYVPTDAASGSGTWGSGTCTGSQCCSTDQNYNSEKKVCETKPATTTAATSSGFQLMSMSNLEGLMTRTEPNKHKPDASFSEAALLPSNYWNPLKNIF